jgi:glutathione-independent formaldehyde dehydrogenase
VYVAGAGPVGLAAAAAAQILGAAVVMIGDMNVDRLKHAESVGFTPIDLTQSENLADLIANVVGKPEVDSAVDAVGFEAKAQGKSGEEAPAAVLNSLVTIVRAAGAIGIPGLYVTEDPGAKDDAGKTGNLKPKYNRQLMQAILHDRLPIAKIVNATVIPLKDAPKGYAEFDSGVAKKFVLDPNRLVKKAA